MRIISSDQIQMHGETGVQHERAEELRSQKHIVVTQHLPLGDVDLVREIRTPGYIHDATHQRLVQRYYRIRIASYAGTVAQRLFQRLAQHDAGVLHSVVSIDMKISPGLDRQIDERVARERLEHVIEKS